MGVQPPEVAGVVKGYPFRMDDEDRGPLVLACNDNTVISCGVHSFRDPPSGIGFRIEACLRRLGEDPVPGGPPNQTSADRSGGKDDVVFRGKGVYPWGVQFGEEIGGQTLAAQKSPQNLLFQALDRKAVAA
jgi:hypothetical protein